MEEAQLGTTIITGVSITLSIVVFILYLGVRERKKFLLQQAELEKLESEKQKDILKAVLRTEERERVRIARELHDALGSTMGALRGELASMSSKQKDDRFARMLDHIAMVDESIRSACYRLYPVRLERYGLNAMLAQSLEGWRDSKKIAISFKSEVPEEAFGSDERKLNILRIVEEMINNTVKHGRCKTMSLAIEKINSHLQITHIHDGIPFKEIPATGEGRGIGLESMKSRVDFLNGRMTYHNDGTGQRVLISLPFEN